MRKFLLLSSLFVSVLSANAQVTPKVQPETLTDGTTYVLVNKAQTGTQYMSRTSWDGALYFLGESDSHYADHAFTAVHNEDGTWSFTIPSTEEDGAFFYMGIPDGSDNLNLKSSEPVYWTVEESDYPGFYRLTAGQGNNPNCMNKQLHLNAGYQYFVISEPINGGQWFPDYAGGATKTGEYDDKEEEIVIINDYTSFNWGFVQVENLPAYMEDIKYSGTINKYYADYCSIEDYKDGFMATYDVVAKAYNDATDADALLEAGIPEMINAKVALYKEIEAAIALNVDDNAVLNAAIATALKAFGEKTATTEVEAATTTLKNAETSYSMGSGDITSLGVNMSFEDLSAQGGSMSSSGGPAPYGWNVYINGQQLADGANASMGWHGVNDDSEGDIKDGTMSFGIWNSGIPTYEISQTIEGLETGTYEITAGLMAGSNGNGSRLTTQRIFGNLNSTYYGSDFDYNVEELDKSEVYTFAGNEIITTDREMRPVTVRAFVYDGTLTFGVRTDGNYAANYRDASNGAGGDGWFKTDNYTIKNLGYVAEDAIAIYDYYVDQLKEFEGLPMAAVVADKMTESQLGGLTEESKKEDIVAGILAAKDFVVEVNASVKAYEKLSAAIEQHWIYLAQYENKLGAGEYGDVIGAAQEAYEMGSADDAAAVDAIIAGLNDALQACIQSDEIEEGDELTDYIKNPSFEDLSAQGGNNSDGVVAPPAGWTMVMNGMECTSPSDYTTAGANLGWCAINSGDNIDEVDEEGNSWTNQYTDGEHVWGIWAGNVPEVELSQTIKGLPAGTYTLTCDMVVQWNWGGQCLTTQRIFANEYVQMFGSEDVYAEHPNDTDDMIAAAKDDAEYPDAEVKHLTYAGHVQSSQYGVTSCPRPMSLTFGLAEGQELKFGFRTNNVDVEVGEAHPYDSAGWFKLDNFRLVYNSKEVPAGALATRISDVENAAEVTSEIYTVNGVRLNALQKGINIVKMSNGKVNKVLVK